MNSVRTYTFQQLFAPLKEGVADQGIYIMKTFQDQFKTQIPNPFRLDHFTVVLVKQGDIVVNVNLVKYTVPRQHVLVLSPHEVRHFLSISDDIEMISMAFTLKYLESAGIHLKDIDVFEFLSAQSSPLLKLSRSDFEMLVKMVEILAYKVQNNNSRAHQTEVAINIFSGFIYDLGSLYNQQHVAGTLSGTRKEQLTFEFMKLLQQNFRKVRSTRAYAELLHVTPKHLSQTLKERSGKTASAYIEEKVIMEAKILLSNPRLTIGEIAGMLDFKDQFIFSRYFKKHSGLSPSQYRHLV